MYRRIVLGLAVLAVGGSILGGCKKETPEKTEAPPTAPAPPAAPEQAKTGEALFKQHCTVCHPDGGNTINPKKTLLRTVREANGVITADDIIMKMRNPGPGMNKFDEKLIPDKDAKAIADYVLKTFN